VPIERTEHVDGSWEEKATDAKSAQELFEKHSPALQKHGAEQFHKKWLEQNSVGFEKVVDPQGNVTHVTADRIDTALSQEGYKPMNRPRTVVPYLPWQSDRRLGERFEDYMRRKSAETSES